MTWHELACSSLKPTLDHKALRVKSLLHETATMLHFHGNIAADPCSCFDAATGGEFRVFSVVTKLNNSKQIKPTPKIRLSRRLREV